MRLKPFLLAMAIMAFFSPFTIVAQTGDAGAVTSQTGSTGSNTTDIDAVSTASKITPPTGFVPVIETLREIAVIILLIAAVAAAISAMTGNVKMAVYVILGAFVLFGAFWVVTMIAESLGTPTTSDITTLKPFNVPDVSGLSPDYGPSGPIKAALNAGLNILTSLTLPFIMIYGLWLSLAIAAGESDQNVMKGYFLGALVALSANIFAQVFKIF